MTYKYWRGGVVGAIVGIACTAAILIYHPLGPVDEKIGERAAEIVFYLQLLGFPLSLIAIRGSYAGLLWVHGIPAVIQFILIGLFIDRYLSQRNNKTNICNREDVV